MEKKHLTIHLQIEKIQKKHLSRGFFFKKLKTTRHHLPEIVVAQEVLRKGCRSRVEACRACRVSL